jgi:glycosyltransferase involved in cell wall biosynthesis
MGPQDGVDTVVRAADHVVNGMGRTDIAFTLIGRGDCFDDLVSLRDEFGLDDHVYFTGRAPDDDVRAILSTADLGLSPDPLNPLNDASTMNKTVEYMAFGLPVIAFELHETQVSAAGAARYVTPGDVQEYARAIVELLDDPTARTAMSARALARVRTKLAWHHQREAYLDVYRRWIPLPRRPLVDLAALEPAARPSSAVEIGGQYRRGDSALSSVS